MNNFFLILGMIFGCVLLNGITLLITRTEISKMKAKAKTEVNEMYAEGGKFLKEAETSLATARKHQIDSQATLKRIDILETKFKTRIGIITG